MPAIGVVSSCVRRRTARRRAARRPWRRRSAARHRPREIAHALLGAGDAELGHEGGLVERSILAGRLAQRRGVALDVEQVVGDLECFAERAAVIVERLIFFRRGLAEQRAGDAAEAQQRAGLHLLQPRDVDRLAVAEPAFAGEIEHLSADHAADADGARQRARQQQPHIGILVDLVAGDDVEGQRQQRVAGQDRGGVVGLLVQGRAAAAQVAVVHRRQVVMDQRIAMDAFQRRAGQQRGLARDAEHRGAFDHQKRPQPLAAAEARIAHGVHQPLRPRDFVGQQRVGQQLRQQRFGVFGGLVQPFRKVGGEVPVVIKE